MEPYLNIEKGSHPSANDGMCVMEAVAYFVGEKHTDKPSCTSKSITNALINFNDGFPFDGNEDRTNTLLPLIPMIVGTNTNLNDEVTRSFIAANYAVRIFLPLYYDFIGKKSEADKFRKLDKIVDVKSANAANAAAANAAAANAAYYAAAANAAANAAAYYAANAAAANAAAYNAAAYNAAAYYAAAANAANAVANAAYNAANAAYYAAVAANAYVEYNIFKDSLKLAFVSMITEMSKVGVKRFEFKNEEYNKAFELLSVK